MKNTRKIALVLIGLLFMLVFPTGCGNTAPTAEIVIFHTNDTHGRVMGNEWDVIGIDRIAAIYKNTPSSILVDAGDAFHGLPTATLGKGADIAEIMTFAGYDAMVVGNHEFNYGWERLAELREIAGFPLLASNVTKDGSPFLDDTVILEVNGVKIGLFGITTEATADGSAMPEYVRGLDFADPVTTAREKAANLKKQGVHVIVALCHLGDEPYSGTISTDIARVVPDINVIIDGHSHSELPEGHMENGVLIAQTGQHGNNLGKVTISLEKGKITSKTAMLITFEEAQEILPDEAVAAKMNEMEAGYETMLGETVGESKVEMSSEEAPGVRTQEMPLGSFVADAYREIADVDIAVTNGGGLRADIISGVITKRDVITILPFGNTLMVKTVTPAILREALENSVSGIVTDSDGNIDHDESAQGRFLQVSGFSFVYNPTASEGQRVVSIMLDDGRKLMLDDTVTELTLASNNYVMSGGGDYTMLGDLPVLRELGAEDEALAEYIKRQSPIEVPITGRIIEKGSEVRAYADYIGIGTKIAVEAGDVFDVVSRDVFKTEAKEYPTVEDMLEALLSGEVDAALLSNGSSRLIMDSGDYPDFEYLLVPEDVYINRAAPVFHTEELRDKYNEWFTGMSAKGTWQEIVDRWIGAPLPKQEDIPQFDLSGENGVLKMCDTGSYAPLTYFDDNGKLAGFNVDMMSRFAQHMGMSLEIEVVPYAEIADYVASGKADMSACTLAMTDERTVNIIFGKPSTITQAVLIVKK